MQALSCEGYCTLYTSWDVLCCVYGVCVFVCVCWHCVLLCWHCVYSAGTVCCCAEDRLMYQQSTLTHSCGHTHKHTHISTCTYTQKYKCAIRSCIGVNKHSCGHIHISTCTYTQKYKCAICSCLGMRKHLY